VTRSIRALIVDDEPLARAEMLRMLRVDGRPEVVGEAGSSDAAAKRIEMQSKLGLPIEVLFLDVNMPEKSGFDLSTELADVPVVVFVTAHEKFAIQAFRASALDYLLKPVDPAHLHAAIDKVCRVVESREQGHLTLFLKDGQRLHLLNTKEIIRIDSLGNHAVFQHAGKDITTLTTLDALEARLPLGRFFRVNRATIVALSQLESVQQREGGLFAVLKNGDRLEFSVRRGRAFRETFKNMALVSFDR
jgi:two-component system, LytTR family, response regulator